MCTIFRQNGASHVRLWGGQSGRQSLLVKRHKAICVGGSGLGPFPSAEPSQKTFYKVRARTNFLYNIIVHNHPHNIDGVDSWTFVWVYRDLIKARPLLPRRSIYSIYLSPTFHMWWNFPVHFVIGVYSPISQNTSHQACAPIYRECSMRARSKRHEAAIKLKRWFNGIRARGTQKNG